MEFLADVMLKKAGRWLRILGFDVAFPLDEADDAILKQAAEQDRLLLTKDEELVKRAQNAGVKVYLVKKLHNPKQVAEIMSEFSLAMPQKIVPKRCAACNGLLKSAEKAQVGAKVPEKVLAEKEKFWLCNSCGHVFWEGSHWERILESAKEIAGEMEEIEKTAEKKEGKEKE